MHLSPEFGLTIKDIEADGYCVNRNVEMLLSSDTSVGITKSMGLGMLGFADAFADLQPDILLILGDRFEIFCAAAAALIARIPIAHLHGGELTEGAIDDSIRHSISKMSHLHFVASEEYRYRVIQLGEQPDNVFCVGGLGIDNICRLKLLDREQLQTALGFRLAPHNLLVTFHPATLDEGSSVQQMADLLSALSELRDTGFIFTLPNADMHGRALFSQIENFCRQHTQSIAFTSLGQLRYLSCMRHVDGVIGNSSSGLLEAPTFKTGTVNIGDRQRGRLRATSVIDCDPDLSSIRDALQRLYSDEFQMILPSTVNPYGTGGACESVVRILEQHSLNGLLKKQFFDLPHNMDLASKAHGSVNS
jgi:GDP/UDP-N,N'-diacetylbacillosamine 2-epimerase (hydrolysing)